MQTLKLWACMANADTTEGRGPLYTVCYARDKKTALSIVNDKAFYSKYGVMGGKPYNNGELDVKDIDVIIVENITEFKDFTIEDKKVKALNKLTDEEKELLGLK